MFVADAHCDTLFEMAVSGKAAGEVCVTKERLLLGGVGLQVFALFAGPEGMAGQPYALGRAMLAARERIDLPFLKDLPDMPPETPHGVLSIEGGEMLEGSLERLEEFRKEGVKMIALLWNNENEIGYSAMSGDARGLKPFGLELIDAMNGLGVLPDVSHLNEKGFWDVTEHSRLPVVASHSNLRTLCASPRNLWPEQVQAIARSNGFIGINFFASFLHDGKAATTDDVLRHIDGMAELGAIDCIGFGSDFDGISAWPEGLADPADFPHLIDRLLAHGYTDEQVRGMAGMNLWRVLKSVG